VKTRVSDKTASCPLDQVNRQFHASAPKGHFGCIDRPYVSPRPPIFCVPL